MATFEIVEVLDRDNLIPHPEFGFFPDGKLAASIIPSLAASKPGAKFQPRPVADKQDWRTREQKRIEDGFYEIAKLGDLPVLDDHFPRRHPDKVDIIMFFSGPHDGERDRLTKWHVNRYLLEYYSLDDQARRSIVWAYTGEDPSEKLAFASTAEEIKEVYENGPNSCMGYSADSYASHPIHPAEAYAGHGLEIAYLQNDGQITARTLVWPEKKIFGRLYGDEYQLRLALEAKGYVEYWWGFQGARLSTRWVDGEDEDHDWHEGWLAPYVDVGYYGRIENDNTIVLDHFRGDISLCSTSGISEEGNVSMEDTTSGAYREQLVCWKEGKFHDRDEAEKRFDMVYVECHSGFYPKDECRQLDDGVWVHNNCGSSCSVVCPITGKTLYRNHAALYQDKRYSWEGILQLRAEGKL